MNRYILFFLCIQMCSFGCVNEQTQTAHHAALPHTLDTNNKELSEADKEKLANANGKEVTSILVQDIEQMFDVAKDKRHIFSFWKLDCALCIASLKTITDVLKGIDSNQYRLIFINLDQKNRLHEVNSFIRLENIFAETYHLDVTPNVQFDGIDNDWNGDIPATFFVQEDENVFIKVTEKIDEKILMKLLDIDEE